MSCKSILLATAGDETDFGAIEAAAKLAQACAGAVTIVPAFPDLAANYLAYGAALNRGAGAALEAARQGADTAAQQQLEAEAARIGAGAGVAIAVRPRALQPGLALAEAAVLADFVVFAGASVRGGAALSGLFAEILLTARAPTLLAGARPFSARRIALAWDSSAQAGRALRAALPLLAKSEAVVVLTNREDAGAAETDAEALKAYLALHGIAAPVEAQSLSGGNVAQSLLDGAAQAGCDVLVCGAFGRARLYEWVLGGTTRALVHAKAPPHLLLAH